MNGSAKQSDTEQQIKKDTPNAGRATSDTMLGISKQDISHLGGIWPPAGTTERTEPATSCHSALPAICTTKDGNGISVDDLTKLSADELRKLCEMRNARERMEWRNSGNCLSDTRWKLPPTWYRNLPSLTDQQREQRIHELREERLRLLYSKENKSHHATRLRYIGVELYAHTGHIAYIHANDT